MENEGVQEGDEEKCEIVHDLAGVLNLGACCFSATTGIIVLVIKTGENQR